MFTPKHTAHLPSVFALLLFVVPGFGQTPPNPNNNGLNPKQKLPPDELNYLLNALEESYKAPREVDQEVLDQLRKQYRGPSAEREAKIFREIRRLYIISPNREEAITTELRRTYDKQTLEQEERLFREIRRDGQLQPGVVPLQTQAELAAKLFARLDTDNNKSLANDELPEALRTQQGRWDRNLDGAINFDEYWPYYQASLKSVSEKVASGEIYLKAAQATPMTPSKSETSSQTPTPPKFVDARPAIARSGKLPEGLPDWFAKYDADADGQVGLYEWVKADKPVEEFQAMDRNGDGLLEAAELLRYLAGIAQKTSGTTQR